MALTVSATATNHFAPATVTIAVGGTVTWTWAGDAYHDVTSDAFDAGSGTRTSQAASFSVRFTTPGVFAYYCSVHRTTGMTGTVTVQ